MNGSLYKVIPLVSCFLLSIYSDSQAQTLSPEVTGSAGAHFEAINATISFTVGEIVTETFTGPTHMLTQGFQQPIEIILTGIDLDLLAFLEGPFNATHMETRLNDAGLIPLVQPYNIAPWNYSGSESVPSIPNQNIVDWVLVEFRDAPDAVSATPSTMITRQAAFLLNDGSVVGLNGVQHIQEASLTSISHHLFVIIYHRNHLGIMSSSGLPHSEGVYSWDFSISATQVYNGTAGYKEIVTNIYGMPGGDANADGYINPADKMFWSNDAGNKGYKDTDFNLNAQVSNQDKNDFYIKNGTYSSQVPQ